MRSFKMALAFIGGIWMALAINSCKKENTPVQQYPIPGNLQMISSGYAPGAATKVEVYAASPFFVGYNPVYIALYDSASNKRITQSQVTFSATSKMSSATSNCPVESPAGTAVNGLFEGALVFMAPSSGAASNLGVQVQNSAGNPGMFSTAVNVSQPSPAKAYSAIAKDDGSNLFVAMVQPATPQIGTNNFEVVIYKQASSMSYMAAGDYMVMINPEMPDMQGMTSPNNVNPTYSGNGHYVGKVIFTMSGEWQINMGLMENSMVSDTSHYFEINL